MPTAEATVIICTACGAEKELKSNRLPTGWKRNGETEVFCDKCKNERYVLRAITLPVASVDDWQEFRADLKACWKVTTQASNWIMTELYARDIRRGSETKMPAMPKIYLYPEIRAHFPNLPSQSASCIEQSTRKRYKAKRYEVIWTCASSLPNFRYPTPFPIHNQSWNAWIEEGKPHVSCKLDRRWTLRLKSGPQFGRQLAAFRSIAEGTAIHGEMALYPAEEGKVIMCKMVAWMPRAARRAGLSGTLNVRTMPDSLLWALNAKDEKLWEYHADHLRRWTAEHSTQLQRWSDDTKYEQRPVPSFAQRRENSASKFHRRMASAVQEIAAQLVKYAARRKFAELSYDDSDTSFLPEFRWFALRERIKTLCDEHGIEFIHKEAALADNKQ